MDRRAAALFGGIVAVGLGPAVWLGGTLLRSEPAPAPGPTSGSRPATSAPGDGSPDPLGGTVPTMPADFSGGGPTAVPPPVSTGAGEPSPVSPPPSAVPSSTTPAVSVPLDTPAATTDAPSEAPFSPLPE